MTNEQLKELQDNFAQAITGHPVVIDEQIEVLAYDPLPEYKLRWPGYRTACD